MKWLRKWVLVSPLFNDDLVLADNRYTIISAILTHSDAKLDKLDDANNKRNKNYIQAISSGVKEDGLPKIGIFSEKFTQLKPLQEFWQKNYRLGKNAPIAIDERFSQQKVIDIHPN
jgi:hypothetical protein